MNKTLRERQRELREREILDVAYQYLLEVGYQKMNMDELAARIGIAKMTIYQHFPSKEELVIGIIVRDLKMVADELVLSEGSERPALERLAENLTYGFQRRSEMKCATMELAPAVVFQNPAYQAQRERLSAQWAHLIEEGKAEGTIDRSLSTQILVRLFFYTFQNDYDDLLINGCATADELAHTLLSVIITGMRID